MALPELWDWQAKDRRNALVAKRANFASPRLGKSLNATVQLQDAARTGAIRHGLVTGPLVVMAQWAELLQEAGFNTLDLHSASIARSVELLRKYQERPALVVVNDDKLPKLCEPLLRYGIDAIIGDETHRWRGVSTKRARAARRLCWHAKWARILTGTPAPNHYGNLWGQMVALDRDAWGHSYGDFAERYLILDSMFRSRVLGHKNVDELQAKLLQYATIVRREDVFGPDQYEYVIHPIELPADARRMYNTLAKEWLLDVEPFNLETTNILARLMRLRQLASGYLPTPDEGEEIVHDEKIAAVLSDLGDIIDSSEKAVIFHQFRWEGRMLEESIARIFSGVPVWTINGDNSKHGYQTAEAFNSADGSAIVIVQTQSGGTGISLREAHNALFVSQSFDFDAEDQALSRIYKPGERRTVTYYPAAGTVDDYVREILSSKRNVHEAVRFADVRAMAFGNIRSKRSARIGKAVAA